LADLAGVRGGGGLVEIAQRIGQRNGEFPLIEGSHPDDFLTLGPVGMRQPSGIAADKAFIDPRLRLVALIVLDACNDNDEPIVGVGGLTKHFGLLVAKAK
jgi:hypothetical protein